MNKRQAGLIVMLLTSLFLIFGAFWPTYNGSKYWNAASVIIQGLFFGVPGLIGVILTARFPKSGAIISMSIFSLFGIYLFRLLLGSDLPRWFTGMLFLTSIVYIVAAAFCYSGSGLKLGIKGRGLFSRKKV
jgi:hypothetical protein